MRLRSLVVAGLALGMVTFLAVVPATQAQIARGNIYGNVIDPSGAVMPGTTVTLSGVFGTRSTTTDTQGAFRFLNVDQGTHTLTVELTGFATQKRDVLVSTGQNVELTFTLNVATVAETVTVTAETPVVDTKKLGTSTVIAKDELSKIPSSRDPWALMRTVPGVVVDRLNLAGSESGQQSNYVAKGAAPKDTVWALDGVVVTDMAAIGSSPAYFLFDSFEEVNFSTGGSGVSVATGGLGINIVTKRGTNAFHGGVGGYFTHDKLQSSNLPDALKNDARLLLPDGTYSDKADHTEQIGEYSLDVGGPILKDKLWFYAAYGKSDIRIKNLMQQRDKSVLINYSAKLNWQATKNDMVSVLWFLHDKTKVGRTGAFGTYAHLDGTLRDQQGYYPSEPRGLSKLEWNHVFGASFFTNIKASRYSTGFSLEPQGGLATSMWVNDAVRREGRGTAPAIFYTRPQNAVTLDASYFANGLGGNHEVKFGAGWRDVSSTTETTNPGDKVQGRFNATSTRARFWRDSITESRGEYWNAFLSDTFTKGRFTLSAGLRWDLQRSKKMPGTAPAQPLIPNLLPASTYDGDTDWPVKWNTVSPRLGVTYALDDARKTVLRGSYAWYAGQLANTLAGWNNPVGGAYLEYDWRDANNDQIVQLDEVNFSTLRGWTNVDPNNPSAIGSSPHRIDPNYKANRDHEVVVGLDRELLPNLAVSVAYTWRKSYDLGPTQGALSGNWSPWVGINASDYLPGSETCQNSYCATPYVLNPAAIERDDVTGGALLINRPDYSWQYSGIELNLVKRLSNKWMGRVSAGWNGWTQKVGSGAAFHSIPAPTDLDSKIDGGVAVYQATGTSGKTYYLNGRWQFSANGMYQLPWGFDIAASLFAREGYINPIFLTLDAGGLDGNVNFLANSTTPDTDRFPAIFDVDLRLAKNFRFGERVNVVLSAEVFNLLNSNTEMNRVNQANASTYQRLDEIMAPRIARFGARITF